MWFESLLLLFSYVSPFYGENVNNICLSDTTYVFFLLFPCSCYSLTVTQILLITSRSLCPVSLAPLTCRLAEDTEGREVHGSRDGPPDYIKVDLQIIIKHWLSPDIYSPAESTNPQYCKIRTGGYKFRLCNRAVGLSIYQISIISVLLLLEQTGQELCEIIAVIPVG